MLDLKIKGGQVLDGTGAEPIRADIGVSGQNIAEIGDLSRSEANRVVDATGCWVCPGFIDAHSHSDAYLLIEPTAHSKIFQGITTEIIGNCGCSAAPRTEKARMPSDWQEFDYPARWNSMEEYRRLLEDTRPALNAAMLVGHNNLRASVVGYENRASSPEEVREMGKMLEESFAAGAIGLSTGLLYSPGMFAAPSEIQALAEIVARHGGIYTSHMRSEGSRLLESIDETIGVGKSSGCRIEISHLKTAGSASWHKIDSLIEKIQSAREAGIDVAADRYPYTASCTDLDVILPDWAAEGSRVAILERIRDPVQRKRLRSALIETRPADYWDRVMIGSTHHDDNQRYKGMRLKEAAADLGLHPVDAVLHLLDTDELHTGGIFFGMCEENMFRILEQPYVMIGSDGSLRAPTGPLSHDHPHPRNYGAFTRFLVIALEGKSVDFPEAIRKATSLPAEQFGLKRRGILREGYYADMVVLDPSKLEEKSTYANPHQLSEGVHSLIVNGTLTITDGKLTGKRNGKVI